MTKDLVTKGTKDSLIEDSVNHVVTQEVAQVTKGRSGDSAGQGQTSGASDEECRHVAVVFLCL